MSGAKNINDESALAKDPGFWTRSGCIQLGYGGWVSLTSVGIGLAFNFPAVTIPQLHADPNGFPVSLAEEAWIASIITLVSLLGCLISGYMMDKFGRKVVLVLCQLPMTAGWVYIALARSATDMIIGRAITGVGIGMAVGAPRIFIAETTLPNMRGVCGAFPNLTLALGITMMAVCGAYLKWKEICYVAAAFTLSLSIFNLLLPETPYYVLMRNNSEEAAMKTLKKFRGSNYNPDKEMADMMEYKIENDIRRLRFREQLKRLLTKSAGKPFFFIFFYMLISQMSGITIMATWTIELLQGSKSSVDPHAGNFMMGLTRFSTSILSSILLYKIGRKPQALISASGVTLVCLFLGSYLHYPVSPSVLPQICFVVYVFFASLGYYTLPLMFMYELYPLQIRGLLGGISAAMFNLFVFGANQIYPYLRTAIGHANVLLCFGISSLLGCLFLYIYLPETKDLTLQEIEEYFNERRSTLVSQKSVLAMQMSSTKDMHKTDKQKKKHKGERKDQGEKEEKGQEKKDDKTKASSSQS